MGMEREVRVERAENLQSGGERVARLVPPAALPPAGGRARAAKARRLLEWVSRLLGGVGVSSRRSSDGLALLSDHALRDIGLAPGDVRSVAEPSPWDLIGRSPF